jgi:hypothetical protein
MIATRRLHNKSRISSSPDGAIMQGNSALARGNKSFERKSIGAGSVNNYQQLLAALP